MCRSRSILPERAAGAEVVDVVVGHVVREIAGEEPSSQPGRVRGAEEQVQDPEHSRPQGHAHRRWHDQTQRIVRVIVVDAVDDPVQPRADALLRFEVEHDPVQPVLEQCPQRVAAIASSDGA